MATTSETNVITASLVVNLDRSGGDGTLSIEVDGRENGLNNGKTNFAPGEDVGLLVFRSTNVVIDEIISSLGSISGAGNGSYAVEEFATFANTNDASVSKPIWGSLSYDWIGKSLGGLQVVDNGTRVLAREKGIAAAALDYGSSYQGYYLRNTPTTYNGRTKYPVVIVVFGHTV